MEIILIYYRKKIKEFLKMVEEFCVRNGLENSIKNFLDFQWNGFYSPAYNYLLKAPKIYILNSKKIWEYYQKLDPDFQQDLIPKDEIKELEYDLKHTPYLRDFIKEIMGEDSRLF